MSQYLLIESRNPFDSNDCANFVDLARGLTEDGHDVTVYFVQNGVLPVRAHARSALVAALAAGGVTMLADVFSLAERGIPLERLADSVAPASLDDIIRQVANGSRVIWH